MKELEEYAKRKFYDLQNRWRKDISAGDDKYKTKYDSIVAEGDEASPHSLKLWETITLPYGEDFKEETDHMFVNKDGKAVFKLDTWEKDILDEEKKRSDFVCWVRNQQNKGWALCIKYEMDRKVKSFYPDFLIIRKEGDRYVVDLLEPHNPAFNDNYAKTIGLYEYLKEEKGIARAEIIRKEDNRFLRLNVGDSMIQHDVMSMHSDDDLNNLFRKYNS
jgi:type III restriction enzyme